MNISKIKSFLSYNLKLLSLSIAIGLFACAISIFAFSSPGSNQPPNGNPTFWLLNGTNMYYSGGNVGIGTNSPDTKLQIAMGNDRLAFYQPLDNSLAIQTLLDGQSYGTYGTYGGGQNQLILQPLVGNVGIGTTSATAYKLDVAGQIRSSSGGYVFPDGTTQTSASGNAYYYGWTTTVSLGWSSATWSSISSIVTLTDGLISGITRSGSAFTFPIGGVYRVNTSFNTYGNGVYFGLRFRKTNGTPATLIQRTRYSGASGVPDEGYMGAQGLIQVSAGDTVDIQYVTAGGTTSAWGASNPLNGESMITGDISIERIGS